MKVVTQSTNGVRHKILGWNVGFACCHLCGYGKPASGHTVEGEHRSVAATKQSQPLNPEMVLVHPGCPRKGAVKWLLLLFETWVSFFSK